MIEKIISDYVEDVCRRKENVLTNSFFAEHILVVLEYGEKLANILKADKEIVSLSAYLHDISAVLDYNTLPTHNIDSARIASNILAEKAYPNDKIERVSQCIEKHVYPLELNSGSIEAVCLSNADAISQIVNPGYWFYFAFKIRNLSYDEGKSWYLNRINENWSKLIDPAKKLIESNYTKLQEMI